MKVKENDTYFDETVEFDEQGRPIEKKKKFGTLSLVFSILLLLWFAVSVILMIKLAKTAGSEWKCVVVFGQLFAVFGIFACISEYSEKKRISFGAVIAVIIGIVIIAATVAFHNGGDELRVIMAKGAVILFLLIFVFVGLGMLWREIGRLRKFRENCSEPVEGVCCGFNEITHTRNGKKITVVSPVYEIYHNGERIELEDESFASEQYVMIGDKKELMVNPENPHIFRDPAKKEHIDPFLLIWVTMFAGIPLFMMLVMISLF